MQKTSIKEFIHKLHTANQERITSPEVSRTSQSASIRCSNKSIKKVWQPSQSITHHTEKVGQEEKGDEKRQKYRGMQEEEPVHMKRHRKTQTWREGERGRESEQSIHMCSFSIEQTETTRCDTHIQSTSDRLPTLDLTVHEQQWKNVEWSKEKQSEEV